MNKRLRNPHPDKKAPLVVGIIIIVLTLLAASYMVLKDHGKIYPEHWWKNF